MPINPIQFAHQVCDEFLRYLYSAFPLTDPDLAQQAREMLSRPSSLDIPLVRGPYVSLSEAFAQGESLEALVEQGHLHPVMPSLIDYTHMWKHQQEVFEAVRRGEHVLVSTGTGSGKTESFLYPIVDELLKDRDQGIQNGLKAILVYPMNALANDQLDRLREMLAGTGITYGLWTGSTPDTDAKVYAQRFEGSSRLAYLAERNRRGEETQREDRTLQPLVPHEECCSEEDIRKRKPRILLTNYRQLEILLTRLPDVQLFAKAPLKYLVFDEAHTYNGAVGAEVACLIRRIRLLANKAPDEVICIGTSATLTSPSEEDDDESAARRFASRFFGVDPNKVILVGESYVQHDWPKQRYRPSQPDGDGMGRLRRLLSVLAEPVETNALKPIVEELTGGVFEPASDWRLSLYDHLVANEYAYQSAEILKRPRLLEEAAWVVSQRVKPDRFPQGDQASAELFCYLVLGAAARKEGQPLLRPKVHFFIRGLDEMVVALNGTTEETRPQLFLSHRDAIEEYADRHSSAFLPVLTCRTCGQHFFESHFLDLQESRTQGNRLRGFEGGNSVQNTDGNQNAFWPPCPTEDGTRLLLTNRLLEEIEEDGGSSRSSKWPTLYACRVCGAVHREPGEKCLADGCGHVEPLLPLKAFGSQMRSCPSCGASSTQIGGQVIEPVRNIRAVTVADVHILAQAIISAAPKGHQKLVIFADSRQDAAFQAGWMQDHGRRIRLRHLIYQTIKSAKNPLSINEIVDKLMEIFRADSSRRLVETLLPELMVEGAEAIFGSNLWVPVRKALLYQVLREFTTGVRRRDCLESMGMARVDYAGLVPAHEGVRRWGNLLGISGQEAVKAISLLLDMWRRQRILYVPSDAVFSQYHAKDNEYILAGLLALKDAKPEGLILENDKDNQFARRLLSTRGTSSTQGLLKKWSDDPDHLDVEAAVRSLWKLLTNDLRLLIGVTLRSQTGKALANVWQIDMNTISVAPHRERYRCNRCRRVVPRSAPKELCTAHNCPGHTVFMEPDSDEYDVWQMDRDFTLVCPEEHTAQVPGEVREKIEFDFKSQNGRTNCLVATPTLELGVNIGALDMVLLRNVPPTPSNYWQRAGRAGRQERMAVVVTYCRRSQHDQYFFEDPLRLLEGSIEAPVFNLKNPVMLAKHIRSAILSELLLLSKGEGPVPEESERVLSFLFPVFIRDYLLDEENQFLPVPPSTSALKSLLMGQVPSLTNRLIDLFAQYWPEEASELTTKEAIEHTVLETANSLGVVMYRLHKRLAWARTTRKELYDKKDRGLIEREEEQLLRRCDDFIRQVVSRDRATYTLSVLGNEGFLPGYGIYEGGIKASARRFFSRQVGSQTFDLSRNDVVALREFVPGNRLYANRSTFYVARYHLGVDADANIESLRVNVTKGRVVESSRGGQYGQDGGVVLDSLEITDVDLAQEGRITEDENLRFSMPVRVLGRLKKKTRGGVAYKIGDHEVHHLLGQAIQLVNIGEASMARKGELGHWICTVCGAVKTPYAVQQEIARFCHVHTDRCGREPSRIALSAKADVDLILFLHLESEIDAVNLGESLRTTANRILDMNQDDLQILVVPDTSEEVNLLVYDPMPGGSGLLDQMLERWEELILEAKRLLVECPSQCETSCYSCLKTFRNQVNHSLLNRHHALQFLDGWETKPQPYRDIVPVFEEEEGGNGTPSNPGEVVLVELLREHHFPEGKVRQPVVITQGMSTTPDWLYEDPHKESVKVAVYLDGMSRGLHGDPKRQRMDDLIREMLSMNGYTVVIVQSRDLDDPEMMRQHLRNIANAIGMSDITR